jgi:hypothetical protein
MDMHAISTLNAMFAFTDGDRWRPGIGDPTVIGWVTVVAYFFTAYLCWRAGSRAVGSKKVRSFWMGVTALLVFLGFNKQLDLQTALTFIGKDMAKSEGWYERRRLVQAFFVLFIAFGGLAATTWLFWTFRRELKWIWQALAGVGFLLSFIVIRAASFHHIDLFLKSGPAGVRMNWILELGGIAAIAWPAWRGWKRSSETSFIWVNREVRGPGATR